MSNSSLDSNIVWNVQISDADKAIVLVILREEAHIVEGPNGYDLITEYILPDNDGGAVVFYGISGHDYLGSEITLIGKNGQPV